MAEQQGGAARPPYPREPNVHSGASRSPVATETCPRTRIARRLVPAKTKTRASHSRNGAAFRHTKRLLRTSEAEREGISDTDIAPAGPHGAGESTSTSGEALAPRET